MGEDCKGKKVLFIEDDKFVAKLYETRLSAEGFVVEIAANGDEGLEKALHNNPDFILLDLMLPLVDGFSVLEQLKASDRTAGIPVIVFSNRSNPDDVARAKQLGALDYMIKANTPPEEIVRKMRTILGGPRRSPEGPSHYRLAIDWNALDAKQMARDLGIPVQYAGGKCMTDMALDAVPEQTHDEPWILARFVLRNDT